jgi:hypothetical protein
LKSTHRHIRPSRCVKEHTTYSDIKNASPGHEI